MTRALIIGLCGAAGCGKSTAAEWLAKHRGQRRVRFADPLKNMLRAYYASCGVTGSDVDRRIEGDLKAQPDPYLGGHTPREAMQTLGTEWGRDTMHPNLWVRAWSSGVQRRLREGAAGVVAEDVRFLNEADVLRELGGVLVRIERPDQAEMAGGITGHTSEGQPLSPDVTVVNDTGPGELGEAVLAAWVRVAGMPR